MIFNLSIKYSLSNIVKRGIHHVCLTFSMLSWVGVAWLSYAICRCVNNDINMCLLILDRWFIMYNDMFIVDADHSSCSWFFKPEQGLLIGQLPSSMCS